MRATVSIIFLFVAVSLLAQGISGMSFPDDHKLYQSWVLPGRNMTLLDETITFDGFGGVDDTIIVRVGDERATIRVGEEKSTDDFRFRVSDSRFNQDMLGETGRDGMPWYGKIPRGTDKRMYSFYMEIFLLRPILEFSRVVGGETNRGDLTEIDANLNEQLNVTLRILNHGEEEVPFTHKEKLPEGAEVEILSVSGGDATLENGSIRLEGHTEDQPELKYSFRINNDIDFEFSSESVLRYKGKEYSYGERNRTRLKIDSGISLVLGFHNGARFRDRSQDAHVGQTEVVGGSIINERDEPIEGRIRIGFPDTERSVHSYDGGRPILDDVFERSMTIENKTEETFKFNLSLMKMGEHPVTFFLEAKTGDGLISRNETYILDTGFDTPRPRAIFESDENNRSTEMTLYLTSDNSRIVEDIIVDVILSEDDYKEEFTYRFRDFRMPRRFLLNSLSRHITNSSNFNVEITGKIYTGFGESVEFGMNTSAEDGYESRYSRRRSEIMASNNLDERYEGISPEPRQLSAAQGFMLNIAGMVTGTGSSPYVPISLATILFLMILGIQLLIFRRRK